MKKLFIAACLLVLTACEKKTYYCECVDTTDGEIVGQVGGGSTKQKAQEICDYQKNDPASAFANDPDIQCSVK